MAQQTKTVLRYVVSQGDTLERIALRYMGDANQWLQLALLNKLNYPYLSDDSGFVKNIAATGSVTFTRTGGTTAAVTLPIGSLVSVPATTRSPQKDYLTTVAATIPLNVTTAAVPVAAVKTGESGNTPPLSVTLLGFTATNLASVANPAAITGGAVLNVLVPGDTLLVYSDAAGPSASLGVDTSALRNLDFMTALLGTDIALNAKGDLFSSGIGDVGSVGGVPNFQAAMLHRLATPLGFYPFLPTYGSNLDKSVGARSDYYQLQKVRVEAIRTLRGDPRVQDVQNIKLQFVAGKLALNLDILMIGEKTPRNLVIQVRNNGGQ
jgi:hypothetical protein